MYNLNVTIIGAGIGGLTTAIAMRQMGYTVTVYEKTHKLRPAGAGISLWSNGIKILNWLGLGAEIAAIGGQMDRMEYRTHTNAPLNEVDLRPLFEVVGQRPYPVSRTDLQNMLLKAVGTERVHLGRRCVAVEQTETSATAIMEDGERITSDLIVAADGVHSIIRDHVIGHQQTSRYAGYVNWNGLVDMNEGLADPHTWVIYVGEGKRASMMPVANDRFYFFFGSPLPAGITVEPEARRAELRHEFAGWCEPVQNLIESLDPLNTNRLEIGDLDPLPNLVKGRIALLGDSGHATTPTLGQGGCQAIEDAFILTRYLVSTNISVADALLRYEAARKDRTKNLVLKARKRTDTIYGKVPELTEQWYQQLREENPDDVREALAKVILGGPMQ